MQSHPKLSNSLRVYVLTFLILIQCIFGDIKSYRNLNTVRNRNRNSFSKYRQLLFIWPFIPILIFKVIRCNTDLCVYLTRFNRSSISCRYNLSFITRIPTLFVAIAIKITTCFHRYRYQNQSFVRSIIKLSNPHGLL